MSTYFKIKVKNYFVAFDMLRTGAINIL